jgi:hypothetical protein
MYLTALYLTIVCSVSQHVNCWNVGFCSDHFWITLCIGSPFHHYWCKVCWVSITTGVQYAECPSLLVYSMLSIHHYWCTVCWVSIIIGVQYAEYPSLLVYSMLSVHILVSRSIPWCDSKKARSFGVQQFVCEPAPNWPYFPTCCVSPASAALVYAQPLSRLPTKYPLTFSGKLFVAVYYN